MTHPLPRVDVVDPPEAYAWLSEHADAALVDVRTRAEWTFVGVPDIRGIGRQLWLVEWVRFPDMAPNPDFVPRLRELMGETVPERVFFICRSGGRSMMAAQATAEALSREGLPAHCTNVAEGFEGDLDGNARRGTTAGWKARGLPWVQS